MVKIVQKMYKKTFYRWFENIWLFVFKIYSKNKKINIVKNGSIDY